MSSVALFLSVMVMAEDIDTVQIDDNLDTIPPKEVVEDTLVVKPEVTEPEVTEPEVTEPEEPVGPDQPDTPEVPDTPEDPESPDQPDTPEVPDAPEVPDTPEDSENPDQPDTPEVPDTPEDPESPDQPDTPEVPDTPEDPESPNQPDAPEVPDTPEEPEEPEIPEEPETPDITAKDDVLFVWQNDEEVNRYKVMRSLVFTFPLSSSVSISYCGENTTFLLEELEDVVFTVRKFEEYTPVEKKLKEVSNKINDVKKYLQSNQVIIEKDGKKYGVR